LPLFLLQMQMQMRKKKKKKTKKKMMMIAQGLRRVAGAFAQTAKQHSKKPHLLTSVKVMGTTRVMRRGTVGAGEQVPGCPSVGPQDEHFPA
jgi:hypothetical protein